ncbi:hypothetical protein JZ751_016532 [Albula glossodonta]|uniref:Uncharacterized protein n=1 Tax=Albula glossodonta TaxID=121402 RepID=A0A8T2P1I6_9TELE|nr:hypothetical protein JZ751_016532 [Albula glossodonta]
MKARGPHPAMAEAKPVHHIAAEWDDFVVTSGIFGTVGLISFSVRGTIPPVTPASS